MSNDTKTEATETVTDEQIEALRGEAIAAGDWEQKAICEVALRYHPNTGAERAVARAKCERVIRDAQAQRDA